MANFNTTSGFAGLGTYTVQVPTTDTYAVDIKSTIPTLGTTGGTQQSQMVTTVNKNGSPVYTSPAGTEGSHTIIECTALDTITVVFTSSSAVDTPPNAVKSVIAVSEGI